MNMVINCPYCGHIHTDDKDIGDWLYCALQDKTGCEHDFVCDSCSKEFEVYIKTTYKFTTYKLKD